MNLKKTIKNRKIKVYSIVCFLLILPIITTGFTQAKQNQLQVITSGQYGKGYRYNIQGWVYIHIEGEPYERGYQYGYLAAAEIIDMINRWCNFGHTEDFMKIFVIKQLLQNYDELSKTYWTLCKIRGMNFFWDQYPKEYQEEIKGIADGIRARGGTIHGRLVDYRDIFTLNVIEETRETCNNPGGRGRPFKTLYNYAKGILKDFINKKSNKEEDENLDHCVVFIATGDATIDGRIVAAHSLVLENYLAQRTNMILDVQPSNGHRFVMTVFPGYIWSSQDFLQNNCGIVLMETVIWPLGPWNVKDTTPVGVRVRRSIQYSDSIDDVIQSMLDGNNGLYPCDWVMGDSKTGEIASLELGLYNHAVTRTKNGFLWSCCNPKDDKVRWGQWSVFRFGILGRFIRNKFISLPIDKKFEELGNKYYGKIDVDILKEIMATEPICSLSTDCKITDTELMENLGLWVHLGRPDGFHWRPTPKDEKEFTGVTENLGTGWLKLYASKSQPKDLPENNAQNSAKKNSKVIWKYETEDSKNTSILNSIVTGDIICTSLSSGKILVLNAKKGDHIWDINLGEQIIISTGLDDTIYIGTETGLHAIQQSTGKIRWEQKIGRISSKPVIYENMVIAGGDTGELYAFDIISGKIKWSYKFSDKPFISEVKKNCLYVSSGDSCYSLDVTNNKILWDYKTDGPITVSPRIHDGTVYFGSWDGHLYSLDSKDGKQLWKFKTGWGVDTTPYIYDDTVYFGSLDNKFYALNKQTGEIEWYYTCNAAIHSSPIVYGECVFFGCDDGQFYALSKTNGDLAWSFAPGYFITDDNVNNYITTPIISSPVVENEIVYFGANGIIYALDAQTVIQSEEQLAQGKSSMNIMILFLFAVIVVLVILLIAYIKKVNKK